MKFIETYKAAIITFLIAGILILAMFSIQLKQKGKLITESYYELEPEPEPLKEELINSDPLKEGASDKAFNEDEAYKKIMQNFKSVSANDFERTIKTLEASKTHDVNEEHSVSESYATNKGRGLNSKETESYKKLQEELKKRLDNKKIADEHAKSKSTLTYSLKGRALEYYKTPRYLCEFGGKIVVSIKVDADGTVYDAYINGSSNSNNQCLINHAIEYAKSAKFSSSERKDQLGTITFIFKGKG